MNILYIGRSKLNHSVNAVYIKGLRSNGVAVRELFIGRNEYFDLIKYLFKHKNSFDVVFIGYDSPLLVCLAKLFSTKKVVYNALCSVYERLIVSRELASRFSVKAVYYWLSDLLASHSADLIMVETDRQARYFKKLFFLPKSNVFKAWTGVDDDVFYRNLPAIDKFPVFTTVFRGQFVPESGVECVVKAAKILENEDINFIIHGGGQNTVTVKKLIERTAPKNLKLVTDFLPAEELRNLMQKCHLSLGQLSDHPRLERTIPHKCYESLAMRLPYLTAANKGVLELLEPGKTCVECKPADAEDLAEKILWAKNNPDKLDKIAEDGFQLYKENLRSDILAKNLLDRLIQL